MIHWSDYGFDGYGLSVFASEKILTERPETVKKFVRAYMKATAMAIADPIAAAMAVKAMVPEVDVEVARAQFAASVPLMVNDISKKDGEGAFDKALLATTWKWTARGAKHAARQDRSRDGGRPFVHTQVTSRRRPARRRGARR